MDKDTKCVVMADVTMGDLCARSFRCVSTSHVNNNNTAIDIHHKEPAPSHDDYFFTPFIYEYLKRDGSFPDVRIAARES